MTAFLDEPIYVPEKVGRKELDALTQEIQQRLDLMYQLAEDESSDVAWPIEVPKTFRAEAHTEDARRAA